MKRNFTPNRWNWSQKAEKWVFIELDDNGKKNYRYQVEPPQEFIELTIQMKNINDKLLNTTDPDENTKIFKQLMGISKKMQGMGRC